MYIDRGLETWEVG